MEYLKRCYNIFLVILIALVLFILSWITVLELVIIAPIYYIKTGRIYVLDRYPFVYIMSEYLFGKLKL